MIATLIRSRIVISAIVLCGLYLGYRVYEAQSDAASLRDKTIEEAVPTVAVVSPKPTPKSETIVLPGNIVGWYEAPIYARVTGYVKMWHKDYGDASEKRRPPRRNQHAGSRCRISTGSGGFGIGARQVQTR